MDSDPPTGKKTGKQKKVTGLIMIGIHFLCGSGSVKDYFLGIRIFLLWSGSTTPMHTDNQEKCSSNNCFLHSWRLEKKKKNIRKRLEYNKSAIQNESHRYSLVCTDCPNYRVQFTENSIKMDTQ